MIQQACTRKHRRGHDRCNDSRGRDLLDRPGTPRRPHDLLGVDRKPRPEPNRPDVAVVSYLCNLLDENDEKQYRVLRRLVAPPRLRPTGTTLMWSSRCTRLLSVTCLRPLKSVPRPVLPTRSLKTLTLPLMIKFSLFFFYICLLWEAYRDCFHDFSFSLRSLEFSHMEGSSLTTSLRYQALLSFL